MVVLDKAIEILREELKKNLNSEYALDFVYAIKLLENQKAFDDSKQQENSFYEEHSPKSSDFI